MDIMKENKSLTQILHLYFVYYKFTCEINNDVKEIFFLQFLIYFRI